MKSCTLSSEWQRVIHSLYDVHDDDPLPAEYEYLMDKYRKAGQVMRTEEMRPVVMRPVVMGLGMMGPEEMRLEEMRPEEMAYAEWFLLHKLPEVTRELRLDPWALLMSATSSYRTRSYFTPFPSHSDRTLSTLFPSHSDHIQRLSVRPSIRILRDIGIRGIKREMVRNI